MASDLEVKKFVEEKLIPFYMREVPGLVKRIEDLEAKVEALVVKETRFRGIDAKSLRVSKKKKRVSAANSTPKKG
jgi:hypothetical protein